MNGFRNFLKAIAVTLVLCGLAGNSLVGTTLLVMLRVMQIRWTRTWAEKGGRARSA